jgi:flagellar hook assembly protein FlgD
MANPFPTIHDCSGDPCTYAHIYDAQGNFIKEISNSVPGSYFISWDGTDCRGNKVSCGKYTVKQYIVAYGQSQSQTSIVMLKDSSTVVKNGRSACDSLKSNCTGNYVENIVYSISGEGNVGCMCCQ